MSLATGTPWKRLFSVGDVRALFIQSAPYKHKDGTTFGFLAIFFNQELEPICAMRVESVSRLTALIVQFRPRELRCDGLDAMQKELLQSTYRSTLE